MWGVKCWLLTMGTILLVNAQGPGRKKTETTGYASQMQSRAVDTRISLNVTEGQPKGTIVGYIPTKPGFTYRFNEAPREFTLDPSTGEIKTNAILDRETLKNDRYDLVVLSSQPTYPIEVRIVVVDINDNDPEFPEPSIAVSFSESAAAGTRLLLDAASDKDSPQNGVSNDYKIIEGNKDQKFKLLVTANPKGDTTYLHLETTGKLDRETQGLYILNISAKDDGSPPRRGYLQVNVTILDVNDNPPIFDHSDYTVSLNESVPPGTQVLQVMATDNDLGDNAKITYYLPDTERQFSVDPETGYISTTERLQCPQQNCPQGSKNPGESCQKSCVFTVYARDHGSPRQDGRTYVTVNLEDANDHDPIIKFQYFPTTAGYATVDENALNGSVVAAVSVVDLDDGLNGDTDVKILAGNERNHFRLDYAHSFDIVRVNGVLDREEISKYNLTVVATDKGTPSRTSTAFLIIHVNDVNDHEPVFGKSEYSTILSELAPPGTYVAGITATDEDSGVNAKIYYAFVSGNQQDWFEINTESGLITTRAVLDREVQGTVELNISARDGGPNPKWAYTQLKVTILDENDEAPIFSQSKINVSLSEDAPPKTLVAMLTAADHDQGTNGSVTYSLHRSVHQKYPGTFLLDSQTGQLTTRTLLDRETMAKYEIKVVAKDQGIPQQSSTATVFVNVLDVNDNNPDFYPSQYFISTGEDTKIGSSLLKVQAFDLDEGENAIVTYKLESGGENLFSLDPWSGVVTLRGNLRTSSKPIYRLKISARDHGEKRASTDATVEIIKEPFLEELQFDSYGYEFQILEDNGLQNITENFQDAFRDEKFLRRTEWSQENQEVKSRQVGKVRVRSSEPVSYSITYGDPKRNFQIDETTGVISTFRPIDREENIMYTLTVTARSGLSFGKTTVTVSVLDMNDNRPVFVRDRDEVYLLENCAVGQEVYLARARDSDSGINSKVTYSLTNNPDEQFRISEATGVVYLNRPIRAEPGTVLHVEIEAKDGGSPQLYSKNTIAITVQDVNDHTPVFDHTSYETSLLESTPVNERFFALSASDSDQGLNGRVSYSITEGNNEKKFGVFPDGFLYVRSPLDRETKDYYSLTVTVTDFGNPPRSSEVPVVIHVIDENDNPPQFTNSTFTFYVRENEPPDSFVGKLTATDKDIGRNAELIFSLSTSQNDFAIDPKNGFIKTLHVFDREELATSSGQSFISFEATVTDNGTPRLKDKVKINVYITDVNDNAPKFLRAPYRVQLSEGSNIGTQVVRLFTTDSDEGLNGDVFYSIAKGNDDNCFSVDEATGQIVLARNLDRESISKYTLTVIAHDAGLSKRLSSSTSVYIDVLDENDNSPEFTQTSTRISVVETTPVNTELIQFKATDSDLGLNSEITFSISAGNRKDTFHIDSTAGTLFLHKPLDYEELNSYQLNITASDNGNPKLSTTIQFSITVEDANDNFPVFPNTAIVRQIREGIPVHSPIVTITAEDSDSGINGKVTYAISKQEPDDSKRYFGINPTTGVIHTLLPIDRETIDTFRLTVIATDQALPITSRLSADKLVTVIVEDINDNAPIFVSMNSAVLPSFNQNRQGRDGVLVMNIFARDLDSSTNGLVTYDLISGNTDLFRLNRNTGALSLKKNVQNFEPRYQLAIKATDEAVQSERKSTDAYITIISQGAQNKGPVFASDSFSGSVFENEPPGTSILTISAKLGGDDVEYYVTNVTGGGVQVDRLFDIDTKLGVLSTATELDREVGFDTYEIEVYAIVIGTNQPKTSKTKSDAASDKDSPQNGVSNDYKIIEGNKDQKFKLLVTANPKGDTTYLHLETTGKLDRETQGLYILNISAKDDGSPPRRGYLQVNVTILDVNDNPPIFDHSDYTVSLNESVPPGTQVLQVMATDNDLGDNAKITYYLPDTERQFSVDPETGYISTTERLQCPQQNCPQGSKNPGESCQKSCVFTVYARDHGSPRQDGRTYVTVNLEDANDHDPIIKFQYFPTTAGYATVDENALNGSVVAAVSVVDLDDGLNGDTDVKILAGNERNHFRLDYAHSFDIVRVNGVLDREEISKYNLTVVATDKGTPSRTSTAFLIIHVNDVNDHEPVFGKSEYSTILSELAPPGTYVAGITATDEDSGVNAKIYYAFVSGNQQDWFEINTESGLITTRAVLDREVQGTVELNISARDGGPNPKWAYTQLKVTILDENDEAPIFSQSKINVSLSEDAPPKTLVAMLTAADHDQGTNGSVTYSLHRSVHQKYPGTFLLDSQTGQLTTRTLLDRETMAKYEIKVVAKDQGIPQQSSTATVFVNVLDVNDNNPDFYPSQYFISTGEDTKIGSSLLKVQAFDLDEGENAIVTYKLESGGENLFSLDPWSGVVTLRGNLRTSSKPIYRLKISARDHGEKRASTDATVEIIKEPFLEELQFDSYGYEFQILEDNGLQNITENFQDAFRDEKFLRRTEWSQENQEVKSRQVGKVRVRSSEPVSYSITYGDPKRNFQIDETTGVISTFRPIDREENIMYTLTVTARSGLSFGKTTVTVSVLDMNDNRPVFVRDRDEVYLLENCAVGQEVYLARARDSDSGINSKVTYSLTNNPDEQFRISEATGVVYLNRPIRAEPGTVLHVEIEAKDGGSPQLYSKNTIAITVQDVNDHTPVFDHTSYETSLLESTPVNERFFALSASDSDQGLNGRVSYSITEGNNEKKFGVFPDGFLYVRSPLDRETKDYYSLTVTVTDFGNPPRSSEVPVVIHVIDENDNPPQFTNSTFTFYVRENEPPDSFVGKLTATDKDIGRNAELIFSLSTSQNDFAIDPKNGFIKTLHVFDREELATSSGQSFISFEATVTDNGTPRLKDKVKINVYITDVNDNAPKFLRAPYRVQLSEGSNIGTQVVRLFTTDSDEGLNGDVFYSIAKGNDDNCFSVDEATGQIVLARNLDRESISKYTLTVIAHDAGLSKRLSSSTSVYIDVLDENDNSPEFTQTSTRISVVETTPVNTELIQFKATDSDLGLNSEITFSISAGNRKDTFHIDSTAGTLFLHKPLDYEELNSYQLNITASDNGNPKLSTTIQFSITVEDANDNFPVFPNTAIVRQIREGIPVHSPIVTITAEDSDSGINGKVTYAISKQEPDDSKRYFGINPTTGVIHTLLPIDRETIDTFRLTVIATDQALPITSRLSADKLVTVIVEDINDNAPIFVSMNSAVLPSFNQNRQGRDGVLVMNIFARDLDSSTNGLVTYDLISGNTDLFRLNRNTGALSLKKNVQNFEPRYQLAIKATDEAVQSERKSTDAYITIISQGAQNKGPVFASDSFSGSVFENEPPGTSILTISAKLGGDDVEYYVTNVTGGGVQVDRLFDIDTKLGVLSTATELDREVGFDTYEIEVYAIVIGTNQPKTSKTKVHITVLDKNDSPPSFKDTPLVYSVSEDLGPGQPVATIRADDPDTLGHLEYTLISEDDSHFALDHQTGVLRLVDSLDRETKDIYKLTVRASDGIQHTDTVVTVQVTDTNDNPPTFLESAYSFDIPENAARGARVGQVRASDPDLGMNAQLTYTVISDWANDVFSLNPQTGVFSLTARLDYEEVQHYILVVQAQDSGHPALSSTLTVYCNVLDLNDNAPLFDPMSYSNEIFENVTIGTSVVTVSATDLDSGDNGRLDYAITSGDEKGDFQIASNGTISTNRILDRETQGVYNLVVTATDQALAPEKRLSSTVQVTIILKDVNDMSPEFITPNETSVTENIPVNTVVMAIKAVDKDEGRNGYIEYSLANDPNSNGVFSLGSVDGLLRVAGRIDRELKSNYSLLVTAKDRGEPQRSTQTKIFVRVLDENDNSPVFDPKQYSASIAENASIGASVLQVSATDIDNGLNGRVRYSISSGDTNRDFSIAEDTGVVRVAKNLNYERKSRYLLTVRAEDCAGDISGDVVRSDTAEISISVSDINDNPPTFLDSPYLAYVMENVIPPNGGYVITVQAYDADTPPFNSLVRYFIKEGDTDIFRINASTGEISLLRALDREIQSEYTLSLVAMDTGSPPLTGTGTVKIIVQDVNDHSPEFKRQSYKATITENSPVGSWVLTPIATDKDIGQNAKIRYSLLGDKVNRFRVDQDTGAITTAATLDREETDVYHLTLMAQDGSTTEPRATAVNLTISVQDENDNTPTFSSPKYEVYISDKTKAGQFVFGAKATDADVGVNSKINYYLTGEHAESFSINTETGVIKAVNDLGKSVGGFFSLEIEARDGGNPVRSASAELKVHLRASHQFPSFASGAKTQFVLAENVEEGKSIARFKASSPKKGPAGVVKFAIAGGNLGDALKIDRDTGEVKVGGRGLDYEVAPQYQVWLEVEDSDKPPLRSVLQLVINVTDANDNAPILKNALYNASVLEEEAPPQLVVKVSATDADSGDNGVVTYRLVDDFEESFEIEPETGEIYTNTRLDREEISSYELIVEAVDQGNPQLSGSATVLVNVLDKNDNPPRFTRLFSVNVTENAEIGSFVIKVTSSDQDIGENANATYSFTENPGEKFKIDPISGNVTVVGALDREQQDEYLLKVAATDRAWSAETPLTITIQDQNDNAPEFEYSYYSFNFPELQRDVVFVGQVSATDRDKQGPNSVISYSLQQPSDLFMVDPASGEIFSKRSLRYKHTQLEPSPENIYPLTILATDNGKPPMSSECLVTINIVDANNNAPKFEQNSYLTPVPFDANEGQRLVKVTAKDELDSGINAEIDYSITAGNGTEFFLIDRSSGWITLARKATTIGRVFTLRVRATDRGVPPQKDEVTVTLVVTGENKFSPVFTAISYQVIVPENEPLGSTILTVSATDNDQGPNGMVRYEISSGNSRKQFSVDPVSGSISILQPLDYDTVHEYRLNVTAKDLGFKPKDTTATLTITLTDINDNPPVFNQTIYNAYIPENKAPNSEVFRIEAKDIDSPKNAIIQYSIIGGTGKDVFAVDAKTGVITAKISFDYEDSNLFTLKIIAKNPDSPMFGTAEVIVHITGVNEFYPRFIQPVFHFDVSESTIIGTSIGTIQATDQDSGEDGKVYYLFVGSSNDKGFIINSETGTISVSRNLDRETQSRVVLTVMAKNSGGIRGNDTDEAQVIVSIQDGNDPPEFLQNEYEAHISEGALIGTKVITVKAVDKDVRPQNNQFSYSIIGGNTGQSFKVDPQTGEIETSRKLDRETTPLYTLIVGGIDTGIPPATGTATVLIHLTDVNDNGPIIDPTTGSVFENEPPNTKIMTLSAKDPDLPPNGAPFTYTLVGGKQKDYVKINKHTGVITTTRIIDREVTPVLNLLIEVEDSGTPKMKSQYEVKITVLDQNDSPSSPRSVHVIVYAFNGLYPIGKIADVHPNDPDTSGDYRCKISQGPPHGILSIPNGCNLHTSRITPGPGYSLSVKGNDGKHQDVTSTVTVEFIPFNNITVENSITVRVANLTAKRFLAHGYRGLLDLLKSSLTNEETLFIYGLHDATDALEITLAIKTPNSYRSKTYTSEKLSKKLDAIVNLFHSTVKVNYSPCNGDTCENGGICNEEIKVEKETTVTDSQSIIFTSPLIVHNYTCQCTDGFTGQNCNKRQDPCLPNPCKSNGQCIKQGYNFQCVCPTSKGGKYCELEKGDACSDNPCQNGGSCKESPDGSSFFCLCRPGYRGNQCEALADSCRPNPCLNGGLCVSTKPGYKCSCTDGRYGRHCEKSTYGFGELSYMTFPPLDATTNDISFIFATTKPNSLLVYNYGLQTGGRSDFIAIELINGRAVFSFGGARTAITSVSVSGKTNNLADGNWHKITATRNRRVLSLSVAMCSENGDVCEECRPGDSSCYAVIGADDIGTLNFNNQPLLIGGLSSADPVLERPGQVHSDDLVGCVHSVSVNGRQLNLSNPIQADGIERTCGRKGSCSASRRDPCDGFGKCLDRWSTTSCTCGSDHIAPNCNSAIQPISISDGGYIEFKISKKHRRMQLLEHLYGGSTVWTKHLTKRATTQNQVQVPAKSVSVLFRTVKNDGVILYASSNKHFTSVELVGGQISYVSKVSSVVNMTGDGLLVNDGVWHNVTLHAHGRGLEILLDGVRLGEELDFAGVHDFLDPYLSYLSLGGVRANMYYVSSAQPKFFEGCLTNFSINNEIQPFNGSGSVFPEVILKGNVVKNCNGPIGVGTAASTDPLSIGITLVIVFFIVLLVAILVSFVVFRLRKQSKEKAGAPGSPSGIHSKQNGGSNMMNSNGLVGGVNDNVLRPLHGNEASIGYHSENGDVIRGIGGHGLVGPELLSKKFKEREILQNELPRPQRPDIIEREVVTKSPPMREDHHPPLPPSSNHNHDHPTDLNSELPEHYDLENASSIAPSDIDIVYHYKGYREAGGVRKYKATPPPVGGYHHKHGPAQGQAQHRHSPHHPTGYPPRAPPVSNPTSRTHQSTPLARLSPSSEMSAQQPRILTLHDISGKPLQTALLATTSSSGGVGKDVLHSNSERSLNSPVMSQLSGQSSNSRKVTAPAVTQSSQGMGLTAEEIERLNSRPRTSSLVSTLDAVSSSSEAPRGTVSTHLTHMHHSPVPETHHSSTTTDESGNDSFTCSEIEYDNASLAGDKYKPSEDSRRNDSSSSNKNPVPPPSYDGFDSSYRGSMSTLVASDEDLGGPLYRPPAESPSTTALGWDYLLNWGPNFESLAGVFKDIAELPDSVNGRVSSSLRLTNAPKPSEEYV